MITRKPYSFLHFFKKVVIDSNFGGLQWQVNSGNLGGGGNGRNDDFTVTVDLHFKARHGDRRRSSHLYVFSMGKLAKRASRYLGQF